MGSETFVRLAAGGMQIAARVPAGVNDRVWFRPRADKPHLFDTGCQRCWRRATPVLRQILLNRALAFHGQIFGNHVAVNVAVEIDHVGFFGFDQHGRMRGGDDAELLQVH
jgi:hypothetical protein